MAAFETTAAEMTLLDENERLQRKLQARLAELKARRARLAGAIQAERVAG